MTDVTMPKRGRGRPKGSTNKPRVVQPALSFEEAQTLKQRLADGYAEAVAAQALAVDRKRRIKASIRSAFGNRGLQDVEALIVAAQDRIAPAASIAEGEVELPRASLKDNVTSGSLT